MKSKKEKQQNALDGLLDKLKSGQKVLKLDGKTTDEFVLLTDRDKTLIEKEMNNIKAGLAKPRQDPKAHNRKRSK